MSRPTDARVNWLAAAPEDEPDRRDYYVRLIALLSFEVSRDTMASAWPRLCRRTE